MRLAAKTLVLASTLALLGLWVVETAESIGVSMFPETRARGAALVAERDQRDALAARVEGIMKELAEGRLSLRDASRLVEAGAAELYPQFLTYAESIAAPGNLRTKFACNLVKHLEHNDMASAARIDELSREYQAMAAEQGR
ncbi:MAG: hypothetical protein L0Y71_24455 [Gemmataceae bacterium]|nr:hypothetical protein [Gemmataceae bacterium]